MKYFLLLIFALSSGYGVAQSLTKEEKMLEEWLPASIGEYQPDGTPLTVTSKAADKPYTMSSRAYKKGPSTLTIVIFDYKKDPELLKKYTASWPTTPVNDEIQEINSIAIEDFKASETFTKKENSAQLYMNVKDRYLIYLSVAGNTSGFLRSVARQLKPRALPL
jgi:hypothetical protein